MKTRRFYFADEYEKERPPVGVWATRSVLTGLIAGIGAVAYLLGYFPK